MSNKSNRKKNGDSSSSGPERTPKRSGKEKSSANGHAAKSETSSSKQKRTRKSRSGDRAHVNLSQGEHFWENKRTKFLAIKKAFTENVKMGTQYKVFLARNLRLKVRFLKP